MADWLAAAYNASGDGVASWEQDRFSELLHQEPPPLRCFVDSCHFPASMLLTQSNDNIVCGALGI